MLRIIICAEKYKNKKTVYRFINEGVVSSAIKHN